MRILGITVGCLGLLSGCGTEVPPQDVQVTTFQNPTGNSRALGTMANPQDFATNEPQDLYNARADAPGDDFLNDFITPDLPLGTAFVSDKITLAPST